MQEACDHSVDDIDGPTTALEIERLAFRGWRLFPCWQRSKIPLIRQWKQRASADPAKLRQWVEQFPGCNWAVVTGSDSGVFVVDVDGYEGQCSLRALEVRYGNLPSTLTTITGRSDGGEHLWFKCLPDRDIRNSARGLAPCIDTRGAGGYVIVPPSIHPTGRPYRWKNPDAIIADPPTWLITQLTVDTEKRRTALSAPWEILRKGQRNDGLARHAGVLRRKGAQVAELEAKLLEANSRRCEPPLPEWEVRGIAFSILRYPVGGPDPLEKAWELTAQEDLRSRSDLFRALCKHLQSARIGQSIALPIERIGKLMGVHHTSVSIYVRKAIEDGYLIVVEKYVAHRRARLYRLREGELQTKRNTLSKPLKDDLVRITSTIHPSDSLANLPSENSDVSIKHPNAFHLQLSREDPRDGAATMGLQKSPPRCPACMSFALYRQNNVGMYECLTCELTEIEESIARECSPSPV